MTDEAMFDPMNVQMLGSNLMSDVTSTPLTILTKGNLIIMANEQDQRRAGDQENSLEDQSPTVNTPERYQATDLIIEMITEGQSLTVSPIHDRTTHSGTKL